MAKLIDILARELGEWPEGVEAIEQDNHGSCLFEVGRPAIPNYVESIADDASTAKVTRAEWQAAVDALNAPKVVEWEQGDIPTIGDPCEAYVLAETEKQGCPMNRWISGKFIGKALADNGGITLLVECEDGWTHAINAFSYLRPIRTAEQVAAEERDKLVDKMTEDSLYGHYAFTEAQARIACRALYDAGYRKQ